MGGVLKIGVPPNHLFLIIYGTKPSILGVPHVEKYPNIWLVVPTVNRRYPRMEAMGGSTEINQQLASWVKQSAVNFTVYSVWANHG